MSTIVIYGSIGIDVVAADIKRQIDMADGRLDVHISSHGGDVWEGITIMNDLLSYNRGEIVITITGLAASIASVIAVGAGDTVHAYDNAELMIHEPWGGFSGNMGDLERYRASLDAARMVIANVYQKKAGGTVEFWLDRMDDETWYNAEEALQAGLIDSIVDRSTSISPAIENTATPVHASIDKSKYAGRDDAPSPVMYNDSEGTMDFEKELSEKLGITGSYNQETILAALDEVLTEQVDDTPVDDTDSVENTDAPSDDTTPADDNHGDNQDDDTTGDTPAGDADSHDDNQDDQDNPDDNHNDNQGDDDNPQDAQVDNQDDNPALSDNTVVLDKDVYAQLMEKAAVADQVVAEKQQDAAVSLIDNAINAGKILAAKKDDFVRMAMDDYDSTATYLDGLSSGVIPMQEKGRAGINASDRRKIAADYKNFFGHAAV